MFLTGIPGCTVLALVFLGGDVTNPANALMFFKTALLGLILRARPLGIMFIGRWIG